MWSNIINNFKGDLDEFVSTVKEDAGRVLQQASDKILVHDSSQASNVVKLKNQLPDDFVLEKEEHFLRCMDDFEDFEDFSKPVRDDEAESEFDVLLDQNEKLKAVFNNVVPSSVSKGEFIQRFYYYKNKLRLSNIRKENIAEIPEEEEIGWGGEDEEASWSESAASQNKGPNMSEAIVMALQDQISALSAENQLLLNGLESLCSELKGVTVVDQPPFEFNEIDATKRKESISSALDFIKSSLHKLGQTQDALKDAHEGGAPLMESEIDQKPEILAAFAAEKEKDEVELVKTEVETTSNGVEKIHARVGSDAGLEDDSVVQKESSDAAIVAVEDPGVGEDEDWEEWE